ncbi:MAG: M3 family peptidase [Deltaproteobacteria bacterium]|nr:MAG: M3 family peptidase [Deltaproteobacteria bacterium]
MEERLDNPLLSQDELPDFDRIRAEHVEPAITTILAELEERFAAFEGTVKPTWKGCVEPMNRMMIPLRRAWGPVNHLCSVADTPELRSARQRMQPRVVSLGLRISQSRAVYEALWALRESDAYVELAPWQQRVVSQRLQQAEHAGVGLEGDARDRFNVLSERLAELGTTFSNHLLDDRKAWELEVTSPQSMVGMPMSFLQLAAQSWNRRHPDDPSATPHAGPWRVTLDYPSFLPFMEHCRDRELRRQAYLAWITVASDGERDNRPVMLEILQLRQEQAILLGYPTYASLSLAEKMAEVPEVYAMAERMLEVARPVSVRELKELGEFARSRGHRGRLERWDLGFWRKRLQEERYDYTDEDLKPYFPLPRVLDGLFSLMERLFGVTVIAADGETSVWHEDVRYFRVLDGGDTIASFFLDPYSRPENKRGGAWMNDCLSRVRREDGTIQLPVAYLVCNATPPVDDQPALMSFSEVTTLFHEFGHGLQHMLTTVEFEDISGVSGIEWDAVEIASQFMENWCYHRDTVRGMTGHVDTGEPLPNALFDKLVGARNYMAATDLLRQLQLGLTDLRLHDGFVPATVEDIFAIQTEVAAKTSVMPLHSEDRTLCSFAHIFAGAYAAGYYSYKWAEVMSADAFAAFEEAGLDDSDARMRTGRRYRDTLLAMGGSRDPREVYRAFRGRDADPDALLRQHGLLSSDAA